MKKKSKINAIPEKRFKSIPDKRESYSHTEIEKIAKVAWQANKALCEMDGDYTNKNWGELNQSQKDLFSLQAKKRIENPNLKNDGSKAEKLFFAIIDIVK